MNIKKISEYIYEIPKEDKMNVPVLVFTDDKLIKSMTQDDTLKQASNMAKLPGIISNVVVLPDGHQGYGAPIGSVAAFDLEKGVISPGATGFDINCLTGDSRILTEFGTYKKIKSFESNFVDIENNNQKLLGIQEKVPCLNLKNKEIENKDILMFLKKESQEVYELISDSGLKISATKDHPFLTKEGMKELRNLRKKEDIAVFPFTGIREKTKINKKLAIISKIFGYMLGDGTVYFTKSRGKIVQRAVAYGKKQDLEKIKKDLERIGFKSNLYYRERDHKVNNYYGTVEFRAGCYELNMQSSFAELLNKLGMPIGNKTKQKTSIPEWIKESPNYIKRLFLAGFFGAELSSPKTHTKTGFYSPILGQNISNELKQNMREFMLEISELLSEFNINVNKISEINFPNVSTIRLIISAEENNLLKLYQRIGFEYNIQRQNLANISTLYILKKKKITKLRKRLVEKIKRYKEKGFSLKELQQKFASELANKRFIERHYYENASQRIPLDFISFNNFKKIQLNNIKKYGCLFDRIESIVHSGTKDVYDFNISDNHNFIANGFIVSNCGVRVLLTNIDKNEFMKKRKEILHDIKRTIPSGLGRGGERYSRETIKEVLVNGSYWALENKMATKEDIERTEENGRMQGVNVDDVSDRAISRGLSQLGTLGAGNHFIDVQVVEEIYDEGIAKNFGLKKNTVCFMIHCGSRGLGHQVASDYIRAIEKEYGHEKFPDRELGFALINSNLGKKYFSAMKASVNFAFCNRQIIMHKIRSLLKRYFPKVKAELLYDVTHNISKIEKHIVDGKSKEVLVVRKGATRSFGPNHLEVPKIYRKVGQPVIIPGSMSTPSFVLVGTKKAEKLSFGSSAHGAGRAHSRTWAHKTLDINQVKKILSEKDIILEGGFKGTIEESEFSYKDVEEVIAISHNLGISKKIARLNPIAVMIG